MYILTTEWIEKAENNFATAGREVRARKNPNYDAACFHAQQMTERYLKAILQENLQHVPQTHSLLHLLELSLPLAPTLIGFQDVLVQLDRYFIRYRYPGESADKDEARAALKLATHFRKFVVNLPILNKTVHA